MSPLPELNFSSPSTSSSSISTAFTSNSSLSHSSSTSSSSSLLASPNKNIVNWNWANTRRIDTLKHIDQFVDTFSDNQYNASRKLKRAVSAIKKICITTEHEINATPQSFPQKSQGFYPESDPNFWETSLRMRLEQMSVDMLLVFYSQLIKSREHLRSYLIEKISHQPKLTDQAALDTIVFTTREILVKQFCIEDLKYFIEGGLAQLNYVNTQSPPTITLGMETNLMHIDAFITLFAAPDKCHAQLLQVALFRSLTNIEFEVLTTFLGPDTALLLRPMRRWHATSWHSALQLELQCRQQDVAIKSAGPLKEYEGGGILNKTILSTTQRLNSIGPELAGHFDYVKDVEHKRQLLANKTLLGMLYELDTDLRYAVLSRLPRKQLASLAAILESAQSLIPIEIKISSCAEEVRLASKNFYQYSVNESLAQLDTAITQRNRGAALEHFNALGIAVTCLKELETNNTISIALQRQAYAATERMGSFLLETAPGRIPTDPRKRHIHAIKALSDLEFSYLYTTTIQLVTLEAFTRLAQLREAMTQQNGDTCLELFIALRIAGTYLQKLNANSPIAALHNEIHHLHKAIHAHLPGESPNGQAITQQRTLAHELHQLYVTRTLLVAPNTATDAPAPAPTSAPAPPSIEPSFNPPLKPNAIATALKKRKKPSAITLVPLRTLLSTIAHTESSPHQVIRHLYGSADALLTHVKKIELLENSTPSNEKEELIVKKAIDRVLDTLKENALPLQSNTPHSLTLILGTGYHRHQLSALTYAVDRLHHSLIKAHFISSGGERRNEEHYRHRLRLKYAYYILHALYEKLSSILNAPSRNRPLFNPFDQCASPDEPQSLPLDMLAAIEGEFAIKWDPETKQVRPLFTAWDHPLFNQYLTEYPPDIHTPGVSIRLRSSAEEEGFCEFLVSPQFHQDVILKQNITLIDHPFYEAVSPPPENREVAICTLLQALQIRIGRERMPALTSILTLHVLQQFLQALGKLGEMQDIAKTPPLRSPNNISILPLDTPNLYLFPEQLPLGNFNIHVTIEYQQLSRIIEISPDSDRSLPIKLDPSQSYLIAKFSLITDAEDRPLYVLPGSLDMRCRCVQAVHANPPLTDDGQIEELQEIFIT